MRRIAVVPGSFDPITLGHTDVIARASKMFDELHVVVVHNPDKHALLPIVKRVELIEESVKGLGIDNVVVAQWSMGLLVDYCADVEATVLVKGIRTSTDITYETPMAMVNRNLSGVETVFLMPEPGHSYVSSSLVRQVASLGGDVRPYVPHVVADYLQGGV
jgi:pantetheine-phosphate adenylyltransferase